MTTGFLQRFKGKISVPASFWVQFGGGSAALGVCGNISSQQNQAGIGNGADTTEDLLFTFSLPAGSLDLPGRQLFIEAWGKFGNNTNSKRARLYFGSQVVDSGANAVSGGIGWYLCATVTKTGPNTQTISGQIITGAAHGGAATFTASETDTAAITIKVTGQTAVASANDVVCNCMVIQALN